MTTQERESRPGEAEAGLIGPEAAEFGSVDIAGFGEAMLRVLGRAMSRRPEVSAAIIRYWQSLAAIGPDAAGIWRGAPPEHATAPERATATVEEHERDVPAGSPAD